MNSMEIYLAQEEVINQEEINLELHAKIGGVKLKVHPNNLLEGHFITICLKNLYFIRK